MNIKSPLLYVICVVMLFLNGCKKKDTATNTATEPEVLTDFANVLANPNYGDIQAKAGTMNQAILTLQSSPTLANLLAVQTAWRNTRQAWESCEGYLFGPVEDFNYDPNTDTWPLDKNSLETLLASNNPLTVASIDSLDPLLKGYHAIEYVIFGVGGGKVVDSITPRQMTYLVSLGQSLYNTTTALRNSWDISQANNFSNQLINAGTSSTRFTTRKAAFIAIVGAMADICNEVANEKMQAPLGAGVGTADSTLDESSFSHNSTADFKNNITGVLNAYTCKYTTQGRGINQLVNAKNISLDNTLQQQMNAAINAFNAIDPNYESAIYNQRTQIQAAQEAIRTLKTTIEGQLTDFINTNIKD